MTRKQIGIIMVLLVAFVGFALQAPAGGGPTKEDDAKAKKAAKTEKAKKAEKPAKKAEKAEKKETVKAEKPKAAEPKAETAKAEKPAKFRYGADERIRQEYFDDLPIKADPPGVTRGGDNNYFRFRTRVWAEFDPIQQVTLKARLANEFRIWDHPDSDNVPNRSSYDYPDEWVFDNLYVDVKDLFGKKLDLRIGRQELIYGTGMLILEGTPKDGSRTIYFNAVKAVWKGVKDTTIDVFGIYNPSEDDLAINPVDRDLTGQNSMNNDITESGAGVYVKNASAEKLPLEAYVIYKQESDWDKISGGTTTEVDQLDLGTFGARLMPKFAERLSGNFEAAYQYGERGDQEVSAFGLNAFLTHKCPLMKKADGKQEFGVVYYSGDDPDTERDEGWNPLWARYPQFSELYVFCWDADGAGRWSNIGAPFFSVSAKPWKRLCLTGRVNYLWAPEDDGPGGGHERGWLYQAKAELNVAEGLFPGRKDKLTSHVLVDVLEPGDYYNEGDTGVFARWEVMYTF